MFRSLEVFPAATVLRADDASNTVETLRSAVKEAAEDPLVRVRLNGEEYFWSVSWEHSESELFIRPPEANMLKTGLSFVPLNAWLQADGARTLGFSIVYVYTVWL